MVRMMLSCLLWNCTAVDMAALMLCCSCTICMTCIERCGSKHAAEVCGAHHTFLTSWVLHMPKKEDQQNAMIPGHWRPMYA
jgi:hypothetical protein